MIKSILVIIMVLCLYTILTTLDVQIFSIAGFIGFIATWILIRWNKYESKVKDTFKDIVDGMG